MSQDEMERDSRGLLRPVSPLNQLLAELGRTTGELGRDVLGLRESLEALPRGVGESIAGRLDDLERANAAAGELARDLGRTMAEGRAYLEQARGLNLETSRQLADMARERERAERTMRPLMEEARAARTPWTERYLIPLEIGMASALLTIVAFMLIYGKKLL